MKINTKNLDVMKRVLLEAENLLERVEEDNDTNIRWMSEKETLIESIAEARVLLWPKEAT